MANQIVNAAPMVIEYGTEDLSTRTLPREPELVPQHCPKFFLYTRKGPTEPQLVVGNQRNIIFGTESFDLRDRYANHSTVFANAINAEGNACMIQRLLPKDIGPEANLVVWMDVLPCYIDDYERDSQGAYVIQDDNPLDLLPGKPIPTGDVIEGYRVKWVVTSYSTLEALNSFGQLSVQRGDQHCTADASWETPAEGEELVYSSRYPMFEIKASSKGEWGNLSGIKIWAPTLKTIATMPTKLMQNSLVYPYFLQVVRKPDAKSSSKVVPTIYNDQRIMFTFKDNVVDPTTNIRLALKDTFIDHYQNMKDTRYPIEFGDFGEIKVYNHYIDEVLTKFFNAELPYMTYSSDFRYGYDVTYEEEQKHLFNIVSLMNSQGAPYYATVFVEGGNAVRFSESNTVYAKGGSDGTMNDALHDQLVAEAVIEYANPKSELQDIAYHVESIIYDTGFTVDTKKKLASFIAERKDTFVVFTTHSWDADTYVADPNSMNEVEMGIATGLRQYLDMYPESDYFGTDVIRGIIIGRSGLLRNSLYTKRLPLSLEVAIKAARYMGAGNGVWKNGKHFDGAPGSIIESMYDISIKWVPTSVRNMNHDLGLCYPLRYDRRSYFIPALKTVCKDDTSVLNSFFTVLAITQLNKIAHAAWREFSGVSNLSNAQLAERVNAFILARVKGKFDGRFVIKPEATFTDMDVLRGYSWSLPIKIYANNMKTVMTTYCQAYRMSDLGD